MTRIKLEDARAIERSLLGKVADINEAIRSARKAGLDVSVEVTESMYVVSGASSGPIVVLQCLISPDQIDA